MLQSDYEHEKKLVETMRAHIQNLLKWDDPGSRTLVEEMLRDEEDDIDWFEAQLELVDQMGEAHYLAQQMKES
jgi:bacterioferritin